MSLSSKTAARNGRVAGPPTDFASGAKPSPASNIPVPEITMMAPEALPAATMRPCNLPPEIDHHKRGVRVGTEPPPPNRASASLAVLGPELDTDHAVVITAAVTMMANAMLLSPCTVPA
jgi:hypothetical protein